MNALVERKKNIRSHSHNHPGLSPAGKADKVFAETYSKHTDAEFKIYHKGGNYYVYY